MNIFNFAFWLLFHSSSPQSSALPHCQQDQKTVEASAANIIFKSTDGGETWQDISNGLPDISQGDGFFVNDNGLYLHAGNGIYHSKPNATTPFWKKEISLFSDEQGNITSDRAELFAYSSITWKTFLNRGLKTVESNGVILGTGTRGIWRSTDDGKHLQWVIKEGGMGIDVAEIKGGFAAITYSSASKTRRVRTSYDGGKTWQPIDAGLPQQLSITTIIEVSENFFCGHPTGIFRSSDKGKTWKLLLPSVKEMVYHLSVSGNVIYAIPRRSGC